MSEDVHQPHDALFRYVFSRVEHAGPVLRAILPKSLSRAVDWTTLALLPGTFIDDELRKSASDLLFSVKLDGRDLFLYVLFEHQSAPSRIMPLRMLGYMTSIWRAHAAENGLPLPVILPVVLHHGEGGWRGALALSELLHLDGLEPLVHAYVPSFRMLLLDVARMSSEEIRKRHLLTALGRVVLVALARARASEDFMGELVALAALLQEVLTAASGRDDFTALMRYIFAVTDVRTNHVVELARLRLTSPAAEIVMTAAERLRAEGAERAEASVRADVLLKLLRIRFGGVSVHHEERIRGASVDALDVWIERLLAAASVEDVLSA